MKLKLSHISSSKKWLISLLVVLFFLTSTGFSLETHFSGDEFYSFAVNGEADSCCQTECDCCSEHNITIKINDDFEYSVPVEITTVIIITELSFLNYSIDLQTQNSDKSTRLIRPPPLIVDQTSTSFLQIFRC
ncbi:MAG: hypothetical protein PF638_03535 [Candidatus Delongbacteria bacterium]|jgi:hypothetical protein|nr:hypothetical protein [Candidatus Delongbacteria bacterium]